MKKHEFILLLDNTIPKSARAAIARVLEEEQGKSNLVHDRGGYTNWGISSRWYPELPIADLTACDAAMIYYRDYWLFNQCHKMPIDMAFLVFDTAVNQGGDFARKTLQFLLKVEPDGIIGRKTLKALKNNTDFFILTQFTRYRCMRYTNLAQADHTQIMFIEGWIDRAFEVLIDAQMTALFDGVSS